MFRLIVINLVLAHTGIFKSTQEIKGISAASIPMNVMEVAVHIVSERHGTPRMRDDNSCGTSGEQMHGRPNRLGCDEDVGQGVLK